MREVERREAWAAHQRARFMRPDAARYERPDATGNAPAGAMRCFKQAAGRLLLPAHAARKSAQTETVHPATYISDLRHFVERHVALRRAVVELKLDLLQRQLTRKYGYDPSQPRVPAGSSDSGQWAGDGGVRLAAADKPGPRWAVAAAVALELALRDIKKFRVDKILYDLFSKRDGTVAKTTLGDATIFGTNSGTSDFDEGDRVVAGKMRDLLIQKYPDIMKKENVGQIPNDSLYHAEATVLLRAARQNGGTLTGKTLDVFVDRPVCASSCQKVLPYLGLELGDPTVTFIDINGTRLTMQNGRWIR